MTDPLLVSPTPNTPLKFSTIYFNVGDVWNEVKNNFVASINGIYYFTYAVGVQGGKEGSVSLTVEKRNETKINYCPAFNVGSNRTGLDVMSRGCLLELSINDTVTMYAENVGIQNLEFGGYLFASKDMQNKVKKFLDEQNKIHSCDVH